MTARVSSLERDGDVAVIVIDNPPINAGSAKVRRKLLEAIDTVARDDSIVAAVLIGAGTTFIAGSDIREFGQPLAEPQLPAVIGAIEACPKPFVAALHGAALGGGFELALGCDARVAAAGTLVGSAGGDAGHHPRCRRHAAVAAPRRRSARDPDGLQRRARRERRCPGRRPDRRGSGWRPAQQRP